VHECFFFGNFGFLEIIVIRIIHAIKRANLPVLNVARNRKFQWITQYIVVYLMAFRRRFDPQGMAKTPLDNLFHPAKIQPDLSALK
jgi:hypothetical protein